jgi:hypothetical protein
MKANEISKGIQIERGPKSYPVRVAKVEAQIKFEFISGSRSSV